MKYRTALFIYGDEKSVFDGIGAQDVLTVPASKSSPLAREDRIEIAFSELKSEYKTILEKLRLLNVQLNKNRSIKPKQTIFTSHESQPAGVRIDVAPQSARNMDHYKQLSDLAVQMISKLIHVETECKPWFFEEWYRGYIYEEPQIDVAFLQIWKSLIGGDIPVTTKDLSQAASFELVLDSDKLKLLLYWPLVDEPVVFNRSSSHEVGVFYLDSLPGDTDLSVNGVRVRGDSKLVPTSMYLNLFDSQIPDIYANHTFVQPTGLHPTYKVSLSKNAEPPHPSCRLMFDLDVPSTFIADEFQLEWSKKYFRNVVLYGHSDLELPSYKVTESCSLRLELQPDIVEFEIPLHLRYGEPKGGSQEIGISTGDLYWDCETDSDTRLLIQNSFMYENRIAEQTHSQLYHIGSTGANHLVAKLAVADLADSSFVESWTLLLVTICALLIGKAAWKL
ncbi:hypothetical protein OGAPHI_005310 [Ogataea philodendri]|uniref:Protein PBN1 n=1 Tax=Ogataea philodendri TaxID=1378263 RepID=A0A9P8T2U6_9ASCO|nr:uncharacterized protein OGAPHI_005310 [Ogataea philodendri]KAH3663320.1 hypothetical protein OGAPHI_005310 [Ogataea philodendri]